MDAGGLWQQLVVLLKDLLQARVVQVAIPEGARERGGVASEGKLTLANGKQGEHSSNMFIPHSLFQLQVLVPHPLGNLHQGASLGTLRQVSHADARLREGH